MVRSSSSCSPGSRRCSCSRPSSPPRQLIPRRTGGRRDGAGDEVDADRRGWQHPDGHARRHRPDPGGLRRRPRLRARDLRPCSPRCRAPAFSATRSPASRSAPPIDPLNGNTGGALTNLYSVVGLAIFLVIGGDAWMVRGLADSGVIRSRRAEDRAARRDSVALVGNVFIGAVEVAAWIMLALVVADIAFGMVVGGRSAAQRLRRRLPDQDRRRACSLVTATLPFIAGWMTGQLDASVGAALHSLQVAWALANDDKTSNSLPSAEPRRAERGQVAKGRTSTELSFSAPVSSHSVLSGPPSSRSSGDRS